MDFTLHPGDYSVRVLTSAKTDGRTGVEMEALTAAAVAGLTVYDMCKALRCVLYKSFSPIVRFQHLIVSHFN